MAYLDPIAGAAREVSGSNILAKTAAYTVTAGDSGRVITTRGAGAPVTITLPTVTAALKGVDVTIVSAANQALTVASQTADQLTIVNDLTADSVALSTASEIIGGGFRCVCDGTAWLILPMVFEAQTITAAT